MRKIICSLTLAICLTGCKGLKHTVEVPVYIHDTSYVAREVHDSTYIDRWHTVQQKGDTIFVTDEVTKFKYVTKIDTAYKYIEVPVVVTKKETVEVKKPLSWWQQFLIYYGALWLLSMLIVLIYKIAKSKLWQNVGNFLKKM